MTQLVIVIMSNYSDPLDFICAMLEVAPQVDQNDCGNKARSLTS